MAPLAYAIRWGHDGRDTVGNVSFRDFMREIPTPAEIHLTVMEAGVYNIRLSEASQTKQKETLH